MRTQISRHDFPCNLIMTSSTLNHFQPSVDCLKLFQTLNNHRVVAVYLLRGIPAFHRNLCRCWFSVLQELLNKISIDEASLGRFSKCAEGCRCPPAERIK